MTILIPIDFSDSSIHAAKFALTHYPDAGFCLLHIVNARQAGSTILVDINEDLQKFFHERMVKTLAELEMLFTDTKIEGKVEVGFFSETLVEEIENSEANLVVIGTNGASSIDEILLGSNAYLAIKNSSIPLLVIPPNHSLATPKRILFTSDFEDDLADKVVQPILDFKNKFNADMHVLHVSHSGAEDDVKMKINHLIDDVVSRFHVVGEENVENTIVEYADEHEFDLIVLAPKSRGIIRGLFHQSTTKKVSAGMKTALFVIK
ncbi:MAG: universal stress protein [Crocinitomicaceae bacterium]